MLNSHYAWEPYLSYGHEKKFDANVSVFQQGEEGSGFYYLSSGGIKNTFLTEKGEERVISHVFPGMLFGEDGSNKNYHLGTATTTAPSVIYYFSNQALLDVCKNFPEAAVIFINCQVYNFRKLVDLIQLLDNTVERQMMFYLSQYAPYAVDIPINQTLLAKDLGTSRVTINKVIRKWRNKGLIRLSNQKIHILDKDGFYQEA